MQSLPPKNNRVLLTFESIRLDIETGKLTSPLPGERELASRLQVSRKTLRKALELLERDAWITPVAHGRRRQILKLPNVSQTNASTELAGKIVITIAPRPLDLMGGIERLFQNSLARYCEKYGMTLKHRHIDVSHLQHPAYRLSEFILNNPADAYLLQHSTPSMQQWFAAEKVPSLILGSRWGNLPLPAVDGDHGAMAVHAASLLLRNGHKSVALLMPSPQKRGLEIFTQKLYETAPSIDFFTVLHEETPESTAAASTKLLTRHSGPPTAVISAFAFSAVCLASSAGQLGLRIPQDISIISLSHDEMLNYFQPSISSYKVDWENYTKTVQKSLTDLLRHPRSPIVDPALVTPDFVKGKSLGLAKQ